MTPKSAQRAIKRAASAKSAAKAKSAPSGKSAAGRKRAATSKSTATPTSAVSAETELARRGSTPGRRPSHSEISERAYFIHIEEGCRDELENWLRAERELATA